MKSILVLAYLITYVNGLSHSQMPKPPIQAQGKMAKAMAREAANVALAVSVLVVPGGALAARSGGRAGGSSFSRSAPRTAAPARTTVRRYSAPVAVPVPVPVSPFGYGYGGYGYGYGGGISPGTAYLGLSLIDTIVQEQRRAAFMRQQLETQQKLGRDNAEIEALKKQLDAQEARLQELQAQADKGK